MSSIRRPAPAWIRKLAIATHRAFASHHYAAAAYFSLCRTAAALGGPAVRDRLLNSMREVRWPEKSLRPVVVVLGSATTVQMHPHNGEFDFDAVLGGRLRYECEVFDFLDSRMGIYDAVVEIGANVGVFTLYFAKKLAGTAPGGKVIALEPSPEAYARLVENLRQNSIDNVWCLNAAVGTSNGLRPFFEPRGHLTNGSFSRDFAEHFSGDVASRPVAVVRGEEMLPFLRGCRKLLVKIDVEGAEAEVLNSLAPVFDAHRPDVLIEVLPAFQASINEAAQAVAPRYACYSIGRAGLERRESLVATEVRDCFMEPAR